MSEAKPKRKFWQFHLSTAVWLMLVASLLVWLNMRAKTPKEIGEYDEATSALMKSSQGSGSYAIILIGIETKGWPFNSHFNFPAMGSKCTDDWCLTADLSICTAILAFIAFSSEFLIRRREARKT